MAAGPGVPGVLGVPGEDGRAGDPAPVARRPGPVGADCRGARGPAGSAAVRAAGDPVRPGAGEPSRPAAGEPARPAAGEPARLAAGEPAVRPATRTGRGASSGRAPCGAKLLGVPEPASGAVGPAGSRGVVGRAAGGVAAGRFAAGRAGALGRVGRAGGVERRAGAGPVGGVPTGVAPSGDGRRPPVAGEKLGGVPRDGSRGSWSSARATVSRPR